MRTIAALVLLFMLASTGAGAVTSVQERDRAYLKLVFPDVDDNDKAHRSITVRSLDKSYEAAPLTGDMSLLIWKCLPIRNGAHTDRLLAIDVTHRDATAHDWGGETLLVLIRTTPKPHVLDVVDVRADREGSLFAPPLLHGTDRDAVIVDSNHLNASEEYISLSLVELSHDKFIQSDVGLPLNFNVEVLATRIQEEPSIKQQDNRTAVFSIKAKGTRKDPDTEAVKSTRMNTFATSLFYSNGHWHCPRCAAMQKALSAFEKRYGFDNE